LAGAISGGIEATAVWPMEYIKTQLQLQEKLKKGGETPKFTGIFSCARYTYQTTGILSFYRGLGPVVAFSIPKAGIRFGGYKYFANLLKDEKGNVSMYGDLAAGTVAGVIESTFAVTPIETIKTRLIDGNKPMIAGTLDIIRREGFSGVYKGWLATSLKQGSNQGLRFMFFGQYKKWIHTESGNLSPLQSLIGGMGAGCFSTIINNPFDVVKTRMQGLDAKRYKSTVDCFTQMLTKEGPGSFYRGVLARMGRVVPGQGIIFMSYEYCVKLVSGLLEDMEKKMR